ncbi:MarP family serine protease [Gryllotalpicola ginsengisoli]|uniref:MarP family serine protease n=1 Tax=Gryllotalpicola ginsengisoli TaxID=444608 RepID=UPI0003B53F2C|nr:MarP family serine protease [Gryllotalpicola ginsengisoli]
MQLIVDLVLAAFGIAFVIRAARRGALVAVATAVGWIAGFWVGLQLAPGIVDAVNVFSALQAWQRTLAVLIVVLLIAVVCAVILISIANAIHRAIRKSPVANGLDALVGAAVGVLTWAITVWLLAGFVTSTGFRPATELADSSRIVQALRDYAPVPASRVFGAVDDAIAAAGLPKVFGDSQEKIPDASAPPSSVPAAVKAVADSVLEVVADEPKCGTVSSGSGWVVASDRVVTNAHVVAGASQVGVLVDGKLHSLPATVVAYDPETDLAVLAVDGLDAQPLALDTTPLATGAAAYAAGYPGGGAYTVNPARVRGTLRAVGKDIYDDKDVSRQIYSLRADIRPGDSGGPLLDAKGRVSGVVFARSTTDDQTGYALTLKQVQPTIADAAKLTAPVDTGACAVG